jgi:hypothetical protein
MTGSLRRFEIVAQLLGVVPDELHGVGDVRLERVVHGAPVQELSDVGGEDSNAVAPGSKRSLRALGDVASPLF